MRESMTEVIVGAVVPLAADGDEIVDTQAAVSLLQLLLTYVAGGDEPT